VIITDFLSTLMATEGDINSKNPNTLILRKLLDEDREKITLLWVPGHVRIPGNEIADEEAKSAQEGDLLATEKYPLQTDSKQNTRIQEKQDGKIAKTIGKKRSNGIKTRKRRKDETRSESPGYEPATP
jgi:hypothetical protein